MTSLRRPLAAALLALGLLTVPGTPSEGSVGPNLPYAWIRDWSGGQVDVAGTAPLPGGGVVVVGTGRWYKSYVRAFNADGSSRWTIEWGVPTDPTADDGNFYAGERVQDVAVDPNGTITVVGSTTSPMPGIASVPAGTSYGFVMSISSSGTIRGTRKVGSTAGERTIVEGVDTDHLGAVFVTGQSTDDFSSLNADLRPPGAFMYGTFAARFDSEGGPGTWFRWITTDITSSDPSIAVDRGGRVFVAGGTKAPSDGLATTASAVAYLRVLDDDGAAVFRGWSFDPSSTSFSTAEDVAVDAAGRATVVGYAAGPVQGAPAGSKGAFVATYTPDLQRVPGTYQDTGFDTHAVSVAINGRGDRAVLGAYDGAPGIGFGAGDLRRFSFPAPGRSESASSRLIGTTFAEYPDNMGNTFSVDGRTYYDAFSGQGAYSDEVSHVQYVGVLGSSTASASGATWFPYASPDAMLSDLALRLNGKALNANVQLAHRVDLQDGTATPGSVIDALRLGTDNTTKVDPVARLFRAYFLRSPDLGGFDHWVKKLRAGTPLSTVSSSFAASSEFTTRYGALTNRQFVEKVYQNVLYRTGDAGGITYWTNKLNSGSVKRGVVMTNFSESSEGIRLNRGYVDADVAYLQLADRPPTPTELYDWDAARDNTSNVLLNGLAFTIGIQNRS